MKRKLRNWISCAVALVMVFLTTGFATAVTLPVIPDVIFDVTSYGAASSDTLDNTKAIQSAIDAAAAAGGGKVVIPSGIFLSGNLAMKSKVNLHLSAGCTVKLLPYGRYPNSGTFDKNVIKGFLTNNGVDINNVKISGSGTIDGQGKGWWDAYNANKSIARPGIIRFDNSNVIEISGITIINAPNVNITVGKVGIHTTINGVTLIAPATSPNTDGIDVWSGTVDILNCNIAVGDDNIAMDNNSTDILIKGCKFGIGHGCSIGSYASNIQNVTVDSCTFEGTDTGVRMKSSRDRGGVEQNLVYTNLTMTNVLTPISIESYYPKVPAAGPASDPAQAVTVSTPSWKNITFKNIKATGATYGGHIWGLPEMSAANVVFDNVQISATQGMYFYFAKDIVFKNGSTVTVKSGKAISALYNATVNGINFTTGQPADTTVKYNIIAGVVPENGGTVTGTGIYNYTKIVTLTATSKEGFVFSKWTEGTINISTNKVLSFPTETDRNLVANFVVETSVANPTNKPVAEISPNPSNGQLMVSLTNSYTGNVSIEILSQSGYEVALFQCEKNAETFYKNINVSYLSAGVYIAKIKTGPHYVSKKILIYK